MNFKPTNKKNAQNNSKSAKEPVEDSKAKREVCKEDLVKDLVKGTDHNMKVDNIEIVNDRDKQKHSVQSKTDYKHEKSTIDNSSNLSTLARDKK
jgi:phosphopantetheinyl transferase (holo-ACP synthase)